MQAWRIHKLFETKGEEKVQIGGAIVAMHIGAVNGSLHGISVEPVNEQVSGEFEYPGSVRMQVADRVVWLELDELEAFMQLLKVASDAALKVS